MLIGGKYQLGARIGGGGMAEVFEGTLVGAEGFSRPVAIKRMLPQLSSDPSFGEMFVNEARIASLLHHPSVASVLDFDRDPEGRYFIVMELIHGVDLRTLADRGRLPIPVSLHIGAELLRGLDYAHELVDKGRHLRIVHRDVSPHNVMVSFSGGVKLVDFGIAKAVAATGASRSGSLKGKVAYMSPEQAHGHDLDGRSDVFAVGVMLHELLTGRRLFDGATEPEVLARLLTQPIAAPSEISGDIEADVDQAVMAMLARDPARRVSSAQLALEMILATRSVTPRAGIELRRLLARQFPERAPARGTGAPASHATPSAAAREARTGVPLSAPLGQTLTVGGSRAQGAQAVGPARRSQRGLLIGAAVISVAAMVSALLIRAARVEVSAVEPDAAVAAVAADDPSDAAVVALGAVADAAAPMSSLDAAARTPDAAPPKRRASPKDKTKPPRKDKPPPGKSDETATDATPKAALGELVVRATPWAEITIKGKNYGSTPVRINLPAGTYRVHFKNDKLGVSHAVSATVTANRSKPIHKTMR